MKKRNLVLVFVWILSMTGAFLAGQIVNSDRTEQGNWFQTAIQWIGGDDSNGGGSFSRGESRSSGKNPSGSGSYSTIEGQRTGESGARTFGAVERRRSGDSMLGDGSESDDTGRKARGGGSGGSATGRKASEANFSGLAADVYDVLGMDDPYERNQAMHELLQEMGPGNVLDIAEVFESMRDQGLPFGSEYNEFVAKWAQFNGVQALEYIAHQEGPAWASAGAIEALRSWTETDPQAAREWIDQLGPGRWNESVVRGFVQGLAKHDIAAAKNFAYSLRGKTDLAPFFSDIYDQVLSNGGLAKAQAWFESLPAGNHHIKRQLFSELTISKLRVSTAAAADWINQNADSYYRDDLAVRRVAAFMTHDDPGAALDWVMDLPPSPQTNDYNAVGEVIGQWRQDDLDNLGNLLSNKQSNPGYDEAAAQFAFRIKHVDDEAATAWAATIRDEDYRNVVLKRLDPNYLKPPAAVTNIPAESSN